uniref:Uncharacterized protein n=1 Tax=Globisporangium ultimum (strain ATCC 200006 / CBS 805.95 / DAOM BR144) TaxID=431595 RepID=K3X7G0_GLOUD
MDHAVAPGNVPRVLEYAPACKQLTLILLGIYSISFSVTWYRVWWDSFIGIAVCLWGYYVLQDTTAELNRKRVQYFYYGTIASMVSHVVAFSVTVYYICKIYIVNDAARFDTIHESDPGTVLFVFLMLFLSIEVLVTGFTIQRTFNLCAELTRNEFFARGGASRV